MKIPKQFSLGGTVWSVSEVPPLPDQTYGVCYPRIANIQLDETLIQQVKLQTFYHELVHAVLFTMGAPTPHDENFVDGFAHLLHQFMLTHKP